MDCSDALMRTADNLARQFRSFGEVIAPEWRNLAIGMAEVYVYDAYTPKVYQRNFNLLKAIVAESVATADGVEITVRNDTASVQPTSPKGGSPAWRVPWEIEEGTYPLPWYGFTAARPYMAHTAAQIDATIESDLLPFINRGLETFRY